MTVNETAFKRFEAEKCSAFSQSVRRLAAMADDTGAAVGEFTLKWLTDDDEVGESEYVPEITLRVRRGDSLGE